MILLWCSVWYSVADFRTASGFLSVYPVQCLVEQIDLVKQLFPSQPARFPCKYVGLNRQIWPVLNGLVRDFWPGTILNGPERPEAGPVSCLGLVGSPSGGAGHDLFSSAR
jgi:hypothetical protein